MEIALLILFVLFILGTIISHIIFKPKDIKWHSVHKE